MAILAGIVLVIFGLIVTAVGAIAVIGGETIGNLFGTGAQGDALRSAVTIIAVIILVIGILHLLSGIFTFAHRSWARWVGVILGVLGVLFGIASVLGGTGPRTSTVINGQTVTTDPQSALVTGVVILIAYAIVVLGLIMGGKHFRKERIQ